MPFHIHCLFSNIESQGLEINAMIILKKGKGYLYLCFFKSGGTFDKLKITVHQAKVILTEWASFQLCVFMIK